MAYISVKCWCIFNHFL